MRLARLPDEANSPLIIDPNAVLTSSISFERLQAVTRRNAEILDLSGGVKVEQFTPSHAFDGSKSRHGLVLEQRLRVPAPKRSDQYLLYDVEGIPSSGMVFAEQAARLHGRACTLAGSGI
jgi:hypothetical protein